MKVNTVCYHGSLFFFKRFIPSLKGDYGGGIYMCKSFQVAKQYQKDNQLTQFFTNPPVPYRQENFKTNSNSVYLMEPKDHLLPQAYIYKITVTGNYVNIDHSLKNTGYTTLDTKTLCHMFQIEPPEKNPFLFVENVIKRIDETHLFIPDETQWNTFLNGRLQIDNSQSNTHSKQINIKSISWAFAHSNIQENTALINDIHTRKKQLLQQLKTASLLAQKASFTFKNMHPALKKTKMAAQKKQIKTLTLSAAQLLETVALHNIFSFFNSNRQKTIMDALKIDGRIVFNDSLQDYYYIANSNKGVKITSYLPAHGNGKWIPIKNPIAKKQKAPFSQKSRERGD